MTFGQRIQRLAAATAIDRILRYIDKDPDTNFIKLINKSQKFVGGVFPSKNFDNFRSAINDPTNVWSVYARSFLSDIDRSVLKKMFLAMGLGTLTGTKAVRANREKYDCNIPYIILLDPTSACNLKCKGCWSAEYGNKNNLTPDEMESIVSQGVDLGTHLYMFTGGEPLIKKKEILALCKAHPDCTFLAYTNATLIDEQFCLDMNEVGNLTLAISIEGDVHTNDSRRGTGSYQRSIEAMQLLKKRRCLFGISVCYTSENVSTVTSDEFLDNMISQGVKFALYFNYMPVGHAAVTSLIPTPEQRKNMYSRLRQVRNGNTGKPIFVMDFQNDGEYVGGCIAGGRNYFHINSAGDIEPCVFVHYSDSNIRTGTLLDALKNPLFQAFWHNQPFNNNHLRPCPFFENPEFLQKMVRDTGAKATDFISPEPAETLCARCEEYAKAWAPIAEDIWNSNKHPNPKTQYYRDIHLASPAGEADANADCD